jgi:serine O-acetyltransferase
MLFGLHKISNWFFTKRLFLVSRGIDLFILLLFNSYIPGSASIGRGTKFAYGGIGIVLHANTVIGENCVVGQGITIGAKEGFSSKISNLAPRIGDNVYISAGARILGDITIEHSSIIAANAVVLKSSPPHSILGGIPAKIIGNTESTYLAIR